MEQTGWEKRCSRPDEKNADGAAATLSSSYVIVEVGVWREMMFLKLTSSVR